MKRCQTIETGRSTRPAVRLLRAVWTLTLMCRTGPALASQIPLPPPVPPPPIPTGIAPSCSATIGPGGSYRLTANVGPCSTNVALVIIGPVDVSFGGHAVSCTPGHQGIALSGDHVKLTDGKISGCDQAIYASDWSSNDEISHIKATGVRWNAFENTSGYNF